MLSRRHVLRGGLAGGAIVALPGMVLASAATDRRFVFVIQRGAADGLDTVIPTADPAYARLRGAIAIDPATAIRIDGSFALNPALAEVGKMAGAGQALFVHAVASPYRDRSHFDGQNVLEEGGLSPYALADGWLNRLLALLPPAENEAVAIAPTIPMALRGKVRVTSYAPSALPQATDDLLARVGALYAGDAQLHPLWEEAMAARGLGGAGTRQDAATLGRTAASFLSKSQGPRIAMLETSGWDTHIGQTRRLGDALGKLDVLIAALRDGMGAAWAQTTVLVATEFGRTAAVNGTEGTDHGTGAVAMVLGGGVRGGRVLADWPGLGASALLDARDLRPTTDLYALIAGTAAQALALDPGRVARTVFASEAALRPLDGLLVA